MAFQKRISFRGSADGNTLGLPNDDTRCYWVSDLGNNRHDIFFRKLSYNDITDEEYIGDINDTIRLHIINGTYGGSTFSFDNGNIRTVTIENNDLVARSFNDTDYGLVGEYTMATDIEYKDPKIFYKTLDNSENIIVVRTLNGYYRGYITMDWVNFRRVNLREIKENWLEYTLSNSTTITLEKYLTFDELVLSVYNSI